MTGKNITIILFNFRKYPLYKEYAGILINNIFLNTGGIQHPTHEVDHETDYGPNH